MPALRDPNVIVLAFKGAPPRIAWQACASVRRRSRPGSGCRLPRYLNALRTMNPHTPERLTVVGKRALRRDPRAGEIAVLAGIAVLGSIVFGITGFGAALVTIPLATHLVPLPVCARAVRPDGPGECLSHRL
jgi:hypothetical protein